MSHSLHDVIAVADRYVPKNFFPKIAIILGSGLAAVAEQMTNATSIPYQALGIHSGMVSGHASIMACGYLNDIPVICLRGRLHLYEGASYESMALLIRLTKHLGCTTLVVTGAVGSMQPEALPGELMMITDHINMHPGNPLVGPNDETVGPRFISLINAYDNEFQQILLRIAQKLNIPLYQGVYIATLGPCFETPAEIKAYKQWGADAVGMSVVPEVILARHCGMRVACVTAITNLAAGMSTEPLTHEGTLRFGELAARKLIKLIPEFVTEVTHGLV